MQYVSAILKGGGGNAYIYAKEEKKIFYCIQDIDQAWFFLLSS